MRKALIVALFAPVFALPLSYVTAGSHEEAPLVAGAVDNPELAPLCWSPPFTYTYVPAGPRIIHVPDPGEVSTEPVSGTEDMTQERRLPEWRDSPRAPQPSIRSQRTPRPTARSHGNGRPARHRRPYSTESSAASPRSSADAEGGASLSARPTAFEGPSPIRPTPRFDAFPRTSAQERSQMPVQTAPAQSRYSNADSGTLFSPWATGEAAVSQ